MRRKSGTEGTRFAPWEIKWLALSRFEHSSRKIWISPWLFAAVSKTKTNGLKEHHCRPVCHARENTPSRCLTLRTIPMEPRALVTTRPRCWQSDLSWQERKWLASEATESQQCRSDPSEPQPPHPPCQRTGGHLTVEPSDGPQQANGLRSGQRATEQETGERGICTSCLKHTRQSIHSKCLTPNTSLHRLSRNPRVNICTYIPFPIQQLSNFAAQLIF